jgi:type II secretory pathway component PulM
MMLLPFISNLKSDISDSFSGMHPFLAQDDDMVQVMAYWQKMTPGTQDGIIIFGAMFLVAFLALIWAIFIRKPAHRRRHHHAHKSAERTAAPVEEAPSPKRRKWRKQRREHRPINPTLAQTGGLPPVRAEGPTAGRAP